MKISPEEFVEYFTKLYDDFEKFEVEYLWGADNKPITKEYVDSLAENFGCERYNSEYYNSALSNKGKRGIDELGAFVDLLSKTDGEFQSSSVESLYNLCTDTDFIYNHPDIPCLLFTASLTHVGAYIGNHEVIYISEFRKGVIKEPYVDSGMWKYFGIPKFIDYGESVDIYNILCDSNTIIKDYQTWLNQRVGDPFMNIKVDGKYGIDTFEQTIRAIQVIINQYYVTGHKLPVDGKWSPELRKAFPEWNDIKVQGDVYRDLSYILNLYFYKVMHYPMGNFEKNLAGIHRYSDYIHLYTVLYQRTDRHLIIDGVPGPATFNSMFGNYDK